MFKIQLLNDDNNDYDINEKQSYDRLIDGKDIRFKTDITYEQRSIISSIETSIKHFSNKGINLEVAKQFVMSYIDMGASIDRQSRKEIVESLKSKNEFIEKQQVMAQQQKVIR